MYVKSVKQRTVNPTDSGYINNTVQKIDNNLEV